MATDSQNNTNNAAPGIALTHQFLKDLSFENPNAPGSLLAPEANPHVQVDVKVSVTSLGKNAQGDETHECLLTMRCEARRDKLALFICELTYGGVVAMRNVPAQQAQPVLFIDIPAMLFPFARAILSDAIRDGGYPPLLINPINFADLYQKQQQNQNKAKAAS